MKRKESFRTWLCRTHRRADTAEGDLARDVAGDQAFPRRASTRKAVLRYLRAKGAHPDAIQTFEVAWREYATTTLICPICFVRYARGFNGAEVGARCGDFSARRRPCAGRLMPVEDAEQVNWEFHAARLAEWTTRNKSA